MTTKYQPGARVSEYILEQCIGAGTFGEVWRARHHVWKTEEVAVKLPTEPQYVRYLQREGVVVHGLRHPNIVRVLGLDPYSDPPYLIMELVKGPSLKQVITENPGGLNATMVITILRGVLRAMDAAHTAKILHRDLKPGNVMLHLDGKPLDQLMLDAVKVGDFGLGADSSDAVRQIVQSASMARDDQLVGTLAYMAPELKDLGQAPDSRSDLFSIGVLMFELLTGQRPAGAESPGSLRKDVPAALDEIFSKLYVRVERRFQTAAEVLAELDKRIGPVRSIGGQVPPPLPSRTDRGAHRYRAMTCPSCTATTHADDQFCTQCGTQLVARVRRCPRCQGWPGPNDQYCIFCGGDLAGAEV